MSLVNLTEMIIKSLVKDEDSVSVKEFDTEEELVIEVIIPEDEKPNILKELYSEGYSEEYLFPGYNGVSQTIENRVKLDKLIKTKELIKKYRLMYTV